MTFATLKSADNANNTPKVSAEPPIAKATVPTVESKPQHQALDVIVHRLYFAITN